MKRDNMQLKGSLNARNKRLLYREKSINPNSPKREIDQRLWLEFFACIRHYSGVG